jgi:hypothetical protein
MVQSYCGDYLHLIRPKRWRSAWSSIDYICSVLPGSKSSSLDEHRGLDEARRADSPENVSYFLHMTWIFDEKMGRVAWST